MDKKDKEALNEYKKFINTSQKELESVDTLNEYSKNEQGQETITENQIAV